MMAPSKCEHAVQCGLLPVLLLSLRCLDGWLCADEWRAGEVLSEHIAHDRRECGRQRLSRHSTAGVRYSQSVVGQEKGASWGIAWQRLHGTALA